MKAFFLSALVCAAAVSSAADLTLSIDTKAPARPSFPHGAPCVGYATDPQAGGEEAAVACRRAGAWLFRTALCDDATLAFCAQYGLRLFVVLDQASSLARTRPAEPIRPPGASLPRTRRANSRTSPSPCP